MIFLKKTKNPSIKRNNSSRFVRTFKIKMPKRAAINGIPHNVTKSFFATPRFHGRGKMPELILSSRTLAFADRLLLLSLDLMAHFPGISFAVISIINLHYGKTSNLTSCPSFIFYSIFAEVRCPAPAPDATRAVGAHETRKRVYKWRNRDRRLLPGR